MRSKRLRLRHVSSAKARFDLLPLVQAVLVLRSHSMKTAFMRIGICAVWLSAAAAGAWILASYGNAPGAIGQTPQSWPSDSQIVRPSDRPVLVMFAHPQCPCTRASVSELNRLLTRCRGEAAVHVLYIQPPGLPHEWTQSASWKHASEISGVTIGADSDGAEARRFGAESSGYVVLYDQHGKLLFNGGITSARGQAGDNAGANVIVSLVTGQGAQLKKTAVFGCGLFDQAATSAQ